MICCCDVEYEMGCTHSAYALPNAVFCVLFTPKKEEPESLGSTKASSSVILGGTCTADPDTVLHLFLPPIVPSPL